MTPDDLRRFKLRDAESYDPVTAAFDRFSIRFAGPVARRMVDLAEIASDAHVLDVATGTGVVAFEAEARLGPEGRVLGVDLSEGMLSVATRRAAEAGLSDRVSFQREDAERLSLPDARFDAVLSLYALMHFPRPDVALLEMRRVLKPGGRLVVAVGCAPPAASLSGVAHVARRLPSLVAERLGRDLPMPATLDRLVKERLPASDEPAQGPLAHGHQHPASAVPQLLHAAGFVGLTNAWQSGLGILATPEEAWELSATFSSFARKRLDSCQPMAAEGLQRDFLDACRSLQERGGRLTYPHSALLVRATAGALPRTGQ